MRLPIDTGSVKFAAAGPAEPVLGQANLVAGKGIGSLIFSRRPSEQGEPKSPTTNNSQLVQIRRSGPTRRAWVMFRRARGPLTTQ
jgi:hypothetical protein